LFVPLIKHHFFFVGLFFIGFQSVFCCLHFFGDFRCLHLCLMIIVDFILKAQGISTAQGLQTMLRTTVIPACVKVSFSLSSFLFSARWASCFFCLTPLNLVRNSLGPTNSLRSSGLTPWLNWILSTFGLTMTLSLMILRIPVSLKKKFKKSLKTVTLLLILSVRLGNLSSHGFILPFVSTSIVKMFTTTHAIQGMSSLLRLGGLEVSFCCCKLCWFVADPLWIRVDLT